MTRNKLDPSKYQRDVAQTIDGGIDGVKGLIDSNLPLMELFVEMILLVLVSYLILTVKAIRLDKMLML